jgi:hypothetical protein
VEAQEKKVFEMCVEARFRLIFGRFEGVFWVLDPEQQRDPDLAPKSLGNKDLQARITWSVPAKSLKANDLLVKYYSQRTWAIGVGFAHITLPAQ